MPAFNQTLALASHVMNATSPAPNPSTSADAGQWSIPVVLGVLLALFAVIIGVPGAVLAIHKLRNRKCLSLVCKELAERSNLAIGHASENIIA
jgi:hypothetical protein